MELPKPGILTISIPEKPIPRNPEQIEMERLTELNLWRATANEIVLHHSQCIFSAKQFHQYWTTAGHHIRHQINDDKLLVQMLRLIMPNYDGPSLLLFRGENAEHWKIGRIGLCWSNQMRIAYIFGSGLNAENLSGGVLLKCYISASAIISGPSKHSINLGEHEYTVDPNMLHDIEVIDRFPSSL